MRFCDANGVRFAYLSAGAGPLVLLLHGFPDTAYTWGRALPVLAAAGYRAVAPFMRGYAPTAVPTDGRYDADTLGRDVLALIDALGNGRPAIVIGHDWGAAAAYAAAALGPARVRWLITLAVPHPGGLRRTPRIAWQLRHVLELRRAGAAARVARDDFAMIDRLVARWSPAWSVPRGTTDRVKAAFREPGCLDAALGYYRALPILGTPPSHRLPITVPTAAFAGEDDLFAPRLYEKVRHMFRGPYQVVQVPGGHFMHREHPDSFNAELVRTLADAARRMR